MSIATNLHDAIAAVCPIIGVSIGVLADKTTWSIQYAATATAQQRTDAQNALNAFDPNVQTAADIRAAADATELAAAKLDANIQSLINATPTQLLTFVTNNFPSMTTAGERNVMARVLAILAVAVRPTVR
jgi:hypothetical protein